MYRQEAEARGYVPKSDSCTYMQGASNIPNRQPEKIHRETSSMCIVEVSTTKGFLGPVTSEFSKDLLGDDPKVASCTPGLNSIFSPNVCTYSSTSLK